MQQPNFPTYNYPSDDGTSIRNKCYRCPPGYRIDSQYSDWDKCELSASALKTWPRCVPCPEGYYSTEWSKDSYCVPQKVCDGPNEVTLFAGTTSQQALCGCKDGYTRSEEGCILMQICNAEQTTGTPRPITEEVPNCNTNIPIIIFLVAFIVLLIMVIVCMCRKLNDKKHSEKQQMENSVKKGSNDPSPSQEPLIKKSDPGNKKQELFNEARRILEGEFVSPQDQHKFFGQGLKFSDKEIDEINRYKEHRRVIKALAKWHEQHPENPIEGLITACTNINNNKVANKLKELLSDDQKNLLPPSSPVSVA